MKEKQAPRKVFVLENGKHIALTYTEFEHRKTRDPAYRSKWFLPVQGCLVETDRAHYSAFYRDKERQKYISKLERNIGLLSMQRITESEFRKTVRIRASHYDTNQIYLQQPTLLHLSRKSRH